MMYQVLYRVENSKYFIKKYNASRYMTISGGCVGDKEKCLEYARSMNKHLKKFHTDHYGKCIYFVREVQ